MQQALTLAVMLLIGHAGIAMANDVRQGDRVDALFADYARSDAPGAAVGVYRGGQIVYAKGYGLADLESKEPITPRTQFHIASVSKQFAAFAVALLARDGTLDLDADVRRYLPYFPDFGHPVTTRQMVLHTSGLRDQWSLFQMGGRDMRDLLRQQQVVQMVQRQRELNFVPGTNTLYSNTGYTLLAEIVASVSGKTLREFSHERMFAPLGMHRTFFFDDVTDVVPGRAHSYEQDKDGRWARSLLNYETVGATSLFTSIEDFARWSGNFGHPVVGDQALIEMVSRSGTLSDGTVVHYGFGLTDLPEGGRKAIAHSGSDADFRTQFIYYPEHDVGVVVFANRSAPVWELAKAVADIYLPAVPRGAIETPALLDTPDPALLARLPGTYVHSTSRSITLASVDGGVVATWGGGSQPSRVVFRADGSLDLSSYDRVRPVLSKAGEVVALQKVARIDVVGDRYDRVRPLPSTAQALAEYVGDYRSEELDATYAISVEDGALVARNLWRVDAIRMMQVTADHFDAKGYAPHALTFERDSAGRIVRVRMHAAQAYNIAFAKVAAPTTGAFTP